MDDDARGTDYEQLEQHAKQVGSRKKLGRPLHALRKPCLPPLQSTLTRSESERDCVGLMKE